MCSSDLMTLRAKDLSGQARVYSWYFRIKHRAEEGTPTPQAAQTVSAPPARPMPVTHDAP